MANLIAKIEALGAELRGENDTKILTVKLKEADGKTWEWSTFHETAFDGYKMGDVIEVVPELKWKEGRKNPYRNIGSVVGKREASEINTFDVLAGQTTSPSDAPAQNGRSGNGMSDHAKAIERRSIERQTSVKMIFALFEGGVALEDMEHVVETLLKHATTVETHFARQGPLANGPPPLPSHVPNVGAPDSSHAEASTNGQPKAYKMETVGDLFTAVKDRYNGQKTIPDIFDALDVKTKEELLVNTTVETAWLTLQSIWEGPKVQESQPN